MTHIVNTEQMLAFVTKQGESFKTANDDNNYVLTELYRQRVYGLIAAFRFTGDDELADLIKTAWFEGTRGKTQQEMIAENLSALVDGNHWTSQGD